MWTVREWRLARRRGRRGALGERASKTLVSLAREMTPQRTPASEARACCFCVTVWLLLRVELADSDCPVALLAVHGLRPDELV